MHAFLPSFIDFAFLFPQKKKEKKKRKLLPLHAYNKAGFLLLLLLLDREETCRELSIGW